MIIIAVNNEKYTNNGKKCNLFKKSLRSTYKLEFTSKILDGIKKQLLSKFQTIVTTLAKKNTT